MKTTNNNFWKPKRSAQTKSLLGTPPTTILSRTDRICFTSFYPFEIVTKSDCWTGPFRPIVTYTQLLKTKFLKKPKSNNKPQKQLKITKNLKFKHETNMNLFAICKFINRNPLIVTNINKNNKCKEPMVFPTPPKQNIAPSHFTHNPNPTPTKEKKNLP